MVQIIIWKWDWIEFPEQVNITSLIWQVQGLIWRVILQIWGLPNPISEIVPPVSHIRSYAPRCSHLHSPSLSFSSTTLPSFHNTKLSHPFISQWHNHQLTPSRSIHQVQHTSSTAYTQHWLCCLHSHEYKLTPECSFSFQQTHPNNPLVRPSIWTVRHHTAVD
jgi:hypothetical protein